MSGVNDSFLATKIHFPATRQDLVPRLRLHQWLDAAVQNGSGVVLISAPAGFGKSTLAAEWLRTSGRSCGWLSLDAEDNDPARFWRYVAAAMQTLEPNFGRSMLGMLHAEELPSPEILLTGLLNEIGGSARPVFLLLDDYHVIQEPAIHAGINFLLERMPLNLFLILTTRADPPLALARLRARGRLFEVRCDALRFTPPEAEILLNNLHRLQLTAEDVAALEKRTEGWAAGLQLSALSLHNLSDRHSFIVTFSGNDRYIADYLLEEVLQQQSPVIQKFLLQTSILDRVCGPLCDAVTGGSDGEEILRTLEAANLFLSPLDTRRYWFRYHRLFADLLNRRLGQISNLAQQRDLYRRAAIWLEREHLPVEAVSQAFRLPDFELAADLLERCILDIFFRSESLLLHGWLEMLPMAILRDRPLLCAVYAHTIAHTEYLRPGALDRTAEWLSRAEALLAGSTPGASPGEKFSEQAIRLTKNFLGLSHAYLAYWRREDSDRIISLAEEALAALPRTADEENDLNYLRLRSGLTCNLGFVRLARNEEREADQALLEARTIGIRCGDLLNMFAASNGHAFILMRRGQIRAAEDFYLDTLKPEDAPERAIPFSGLIWLGLGGIFYERNALAKAENHLRRGIDLLRAASAMQQSIDGYMALASLLENTGRSEAAEKTLQEAERVRPEGKPYFETTRVRFGLWRGDLTYPLAWAATKTIREDEPAVIAQTLIRVDLARRSGKIAAHGQGLDASMVMGYLDRLIKQAEDSGWWNDALTGWILSALFHDALKHPDLAANALDRALAIGEPEGFIRRFLDEGQSMHRLLRSVSSSDPGRSSYVGRLLAEFSQKAEPGTFPTMENPLSAREIQILQLLAAGRTNEEISRDLVIAINTTKKHITHILEKLAVTNRKDAVREACEKGFIRHS